ncbi:MAG: hypothetical protein ABS68_13110 [Niastella sp. SCN 39-18]|nr:RagB/SusD family nutrient uptake outer membrane protein [Sphingobacteriales bacterium]ODT51454.1 MAG: hypothetical protein ABS68_13110 [Niastella sp. SCN 39-18]OJW08175.1 MAG: hypothetical protein BGO53_04820 [Sphingobacteriales bacterium 39-19]
MNIKILIRSTLAITGAASLLTFSSCDKVVDLDPIGFVTEDSIAKNDADLKALINSGYYALAQDDYYGGSFQVYNELLGDLINGSTLNGDYLSTYNRNTNIFNPGISAMYGQMNKPILQANQTLKYLANASAAAKDEIAGQAHFLRGLSLFDLVRLYAQPYKKAGNNTQPGVPIRLSPERVPIQRSSVEEVYQQIISDLKKADTLLPATHGVYATKWSAKAILARVYFQMNDFSNAYLYANDVIENGGFGFDADYSHRYSSAGTPEAVFQLVYEANNTQGRFQRLLGNYRTTGSALPALTITNAAYTNGKAVATDARAAWYSTKNGYYLLNKFDSNSVELPVILITELKLIRAESAAEQNQNLAVGITDINDIITRAYGAGSALLLPLNANASLLKEAVRRERNLELVGEGNRTQELKREGGNGENVMIRGAVYNCPGLIFPFPTNEVNYNSLEQNPIGGCN